MYHPISSAFKAKRQKMHHPGAASNSSSVPAFVPVPVFVPMIAMSGPHVEAPQGAFVHSSPMLLTHPSYFYPQAPAAPPVFQASVPGSWSMPGSYYPPAATEAWEEDVSVDILSIIKETIKPSPFGLYCEECQIPVGSSARAIKRHVCKHHHSINERLVDIGKFVSKIQKQVHDLKLHGDREPYLHAEEKGFVCGTCGKAFSTTDQVWKHCYNNPCPRSSIYTEMVRRTVRGCGEIVGPSEFVRGRGNQHVLDDARYDGENDDATSNNSASNEDAEDSDDSAEHAEDTGSGGENALPAYNDGKTTTIIFNGKQIAEEKSPLMPADHFEHSDLSKEEKAKLKDNLFYARNARHARKLYLMLKRQHGGRQYGRTHRRYMKGCLHDKMFPGAKVLPKPERNQKMQLHLNVEGADPGDEPELVEIQDLSEETVLLDSITRMGSTVSNRKGNCRQNVGDEGDMFAFGQRATEPVATTSGTTSKRNNKKKGRTTPNRNNPDLVYQLNRDNPNVATAIQMVAAETTRVMKIYAPKELESIQEAERPKLLRCHPNVLSMMGGKDGPGTCIMFSRDLANAAHIDFKDNSRSFAIWVEEKPGVAQNWYFVLPDVSIDGSKGVLIPLFHGCAISWNGRIIRHATSRTHSGEGNHVYGCMFGSCRD